MYSKIILVAAFAFSAHIVAGQCYPDRHSTNFFDGWLSCDPAPNPNPARPVSHFIMYDYGKPYKLGATHIWNTNDPARLDWGMRDVWIDYSLDGQTWYTAGEYTLPAASGLSTYEGADGPYLDDIEARYLLITAISNYGGACYGLSEFHVQAEESVISASEPVQELDCLEVSLYPNPFADQLTIGLTASCSGRLNYALHDAAGRLVFSQDIQLHHGLSVMLPVGKELSAGAYKLSFSYGGKIMNRTVVKAGSR